MLPPVLASPTSYTSATEAKLRADQVVPARVAATPMPMPAAQLSPNTAISGQLNIMMLSGPERMSQNLAALAEVLGSALKIERRADEGLSDYMARLIEGIAALPAGDRLKLQKLLTQVFAGLQLKTLLDAMANPSGPERATLALYLELYRQSEKDGATRSVISSYRELAAEARANSIPAARPVPANDSVRQNAESSRQDLRPLPPTPSGIALGGQDAEPMERPMSGAAAPIRASSPAAASQSAADPATTSSKAQTAGREAQPVLSAKATDPDVKAEEGPQGGSTVPTSSTPEPGRAPLKEAKMPRSQDHRLYGNTAASADDAAPENRVQTASPMISQPAAIGAKPVQPLAGPWMAELLESNFVRALLQLKTLSAGQPLDAPMADRSRQGGTEATALPPVPPENPTVSEMEEPPAPQVQSDSRPSLTEEHPLPPPMIPVDQTLARPLAAREGLTLPFVLYAIEDEIRTDDSEEGEEREDGEEKRRQSDDEAAEDDGEAFNTGERMVTAGRDPEGVKLLEPSRDAAGKDNGEPEPDIRALPSPAVARLAVPPEPAHELYLRMAGLT